MYDNGLQSFAMHSEDQLAAPALETINDEMTRAKAGPPVEHQKLDPETAARQYLNQMITSPQVPALTDEGPANEYRTIGTETVPLTDSKMVKFSQYRQKIPVYGSLVSIELDENNSLLSINSALGNPDDVDPVASVSPADAQDVIIKDAGKQALPLAAPPKLYFYYDNTAKPSKWRLVCIAKDVQRHAARQRVIPRRCRRSSTTWSMRIRVSWSPNCRAHSR